MVGIVSFFAGYSAYSALGLIGGLMVSTVFFVFVYGYLLQKNRRHPFEKTQQIYRNTLVSILIGLVFWCLTWLSPEIQTLLLGDMIDIHLRRTPLLSIMVGHSMAIWTIAAAVMLMDTRTLKVGGPEALMAKAGGPGAKHRDLWEWMYVCEEWLRNQGLWRWCIRLLFYALLFLWIALSFLPK